MTTENLTISADSVAQLIQNCLAEPGDFVCKLFRTDGITQDAPIEQLFANYFRAEPYQYMACTPHEDSLSTLEAFFAKNREQLEKHVLSVHSGPYLALDQAFHTSACPGDVAGPCVGHVLKVIHNTIEEHCAAGRVSIMACNDPADICAKVLEIYNSYMNFVVILETKLPTLSEIVGKVKSNGFPFSLWKFLHQEFVSLFLTPVLPQVTDALMGEIKVSRREAVDKAISKGKDQEHSLSDFDRIFELRAIVGMLIGTELDERSVHMLESSDGPFGPIYDSLEEQIKCQTEELYKEYTNKNASGLPWKTIVCNDLLVLEKTLMPSSLKRMMEHCVKVAKDRWAVDERLVECKFESHHVRDAEVAIYAKRLGIMT